jgi:hypothetical protein
MNNEIINAYHGSKNLFDAFDFSECGEHGGNDGAGFGLYFSTSKGEAMTYGPFIYSCILTLKRELSNHAVTLKNHDINIMLYHQFDKRQWGFPKKEIGAFSSWLPTATCDTDIIHKVMELRNSTVTDMSKILSHYNFTHTVDVETPDDPTQPHYIIYDLNAIHIVETTPTY